MDPAPIFGILGKLFTNVKTRLSFTRMLCGGFELVS